MPGRENSISKVQRQETAWSKSLEAMQLCGSAKWRQRAVRNETREEQRGQIKQDLMHPVRRIDKTKERQTRAC